MRQENLKNNRDILLETRNLSVEFPLKKKSFFEKQKMLSAVSDVSIQIRKGETLIKKRLGNFFLGYAGI